MPIRPPALDDRSFDDLVADLVRRIPAHTPEWTDAREGDPGRTLIDLFAWLGDTILYRANLIPERQRLAFLRLLGQQMRPALPARGLIQVSIDNPAVTDPVTLPARSAIAKPVWFETETELSIEPVESRAFLKRRPTTAEALQLRDLLFDLQQLYGVSSGNGYVATPAFVGGAAEPEGRDFVADSIDHCLWLALLAPTPEPATVAAVAKTLGGGTSNRRVALSVGLVPAFDAPAPLEAVTARAPIPYAWEICTGRGAGDEYLPLELLADGTGGLARAGICRLLLPGADDFGVPGNDVVRDYRAGTGGRPPRIDDPVTAARLVAWLRLRPLPEAKLSSFKLAWAGVNAVAIEQRRTLGRQQIGRGTGASGQSLPLGTAGVDPATLIVEVEEEEGLRAWRQVGDVAAAARGERVYSLDSEAGTIAFGDGVRGAVPQPGRAIQVAYMRAGGGVAGNLAPGAIRAVEAPAGAPKLKVLQPLPTTGGVDAEALADAEARIPAAIRNGSRAVTRGDVRELALRTPGLAVGRVEVLERFKPQQRRFDIPGVVSVMVIPARAGTLKPAPRADRPMLETVYGWLDQRRPLATELYVIAPDYVPIGVSAAVELSDPDQRDAVLDLVSDAIRLHLWPLAPGGPDGQGWPLGRAVDDRLIETAVARVPGVRTVAPVRLFTRRPGGAGGWVPVAEANGRRTIAVQPWQLPELAMLAVGVGADAAASLPPGGAGDGGLAIPVVPELC
ncbi:MAG: putative baseplate assembly protein [Alphaproteobacteria bacterium]|nr:putative baseplate assembly protein [Alphaproteobacteria bacterium]